MANVSVAEVSLFTWEVKAMTAVSPFAVLMKTGPSSLSGFEYKL
jgi:hypothetical protein